MPRATFHDGPEDWQQPNTPTIWPRDKTPAVGSAEIGKASPMQPGNLNPIHGYNNMNTQDDLNEEIMARLANIEAALVILAQGGATGEGEEGNPDEGPQTSNAEAPFGSDPNAPESLATQMQKKVPTGDSMRARLAVADQQCSRVLSSINQQNKKHYGLTH